MRFSSCNKVFSLAIVFLLVACGGGGDGGSGFAPVVYQGNTAQARISTANAPDISGKVVESMSVLDDDSLAFRSAESEVAPQQASYVDYAIGRISQIRDRLIKQESDRRSQSAYAQRTDIDQTDSCDSGTVRSNGFFEDDFTGQITFTFIGCVFGVDRLDGQLSIQIHSFDLVAFLDTSISVNVVSLTLVNPDFNVSLSASINYLLNVGLNQETETVQSLVIRDNASGDMVQITNLVSVVTYDNISFPTSASVAINSGRVFHSLHGYVDIVTSTPLSYGTLGQLYPDGGEILLSGDGNIRITALNVIQVRIEVDTDNNLGNGYEELTELNWADL